MTIKDTLLKDIKEPISRATAISALAIILATVAIIIASKKSGGK